MKNKKLRDIIIECLSEYYDYERQSAPDEKEVITADPETEEQEITTIPSPRINPWSPRKISPEQNPKPKAESVISIIREEVKNYLLVRENIKMSKQNYLQTNKITLEDLDRIIAIDPTPQKKYVLWLTKRFVDENIKDLDLLRNTIEEFNVFVSHNRVEQKDIMQYKTFEELKKIVDNLNQSNTASSKELEKDYDVIVDKPELYIVKPNTWEASRKLGLTRFAHRYNPETKTKDCSWCTTYKSDSHFGRYYLNSHDTLYYVDLGGELEKQVTEKFGNKLKQFAVLVKKDGKKLVYDTTDAEYTGQKATNILNTIGIK